MKRVEIKVYSLMIYNDDGDPFIFLYQTRQQCIDHVYEMVQENWQYNFGDGEEDDQIDDYEKEEAIDHFYESDNGHYVIELHNLSYSMMELQDQIAKAIGLATHG